MVMSSSPVGVTYILYTALILGKEFFDIQATIESRLTLKPVLDMIRT